MADDLVADLVALLIDCRDRVLAEVLILDHRHRVVQLGIERIADLTKRLDLELLKAGFQLSGDHLDALTEFLGHVLAVKLRERLGHAVRER